LDHGDVTKLLLDLRAGKPEAMASLMPLVYRELRRLAAHFMKEERGDHTLQATALVHEAYIRLVAEPDRNWQNRSQFFAVAGHAMRRVLVDHARANLAQKRGQGQVHLDLEEARAQAVPEPPHILALDDVLQRFEQIDPRASRVVELRWFVGLSVTEAAEAMGVSEKTVQRDWDFAKAWLQSALDEPTRSK
jgi:RNA polymerase sigma factor (TIGR02999 family)